MPGLEIKEVFNRTGAGVKTQTGGKQIPAVYNQFFDNAYLSGVAAQTAPVSSLSKPADARVKSYEAGADILVDGVPKGKAPVLVQELPTDRIIRIEARGPSSAGSLELSLKPGELREVMVTMEKLSGNIIITSSEDSLTLLLDGADKGPIGSGVLRGLGVGEHRIELVGKDLYFAKTVAIAANATIQVAAKLVAVGKLELRVPPEARVTIEGGDDRESSRRQL